MSADDKQLDTIELQIETTSTCNAVCHFCVYPKVMKWRAGKTMGMELYRKIIDEAATIPQIQGVKLVGLNEPLLDPLLPERFAYLRDKMPHVFRQIYTNGVLLTPERHDRLREAGVTSIVVSLNAVTQEQHTRIMGIKGKFEQTCSNIEYAISKSGHNGHIEVHAVANGDQFTMQDVKDFNIRWGHAGSGGYGCCVWECNWAGGNRTIRDFKPWEWCWRALTQIYVMYDGRISACCLDPTGRLILGDLNKQTIREAYNSGVFLKFREDHFANEADKWEICKNCTRI